MKKNKQNQKFPGFPPKPNINFWSYPKDLDNYWYLLTGSEQKVLDYILRRTWGFKKTQDEISLNQLENGINNFDKGTGLSRPSIIFAIRGLIKKNFIKKARGKKANSYELVINLNHPDKEILPSECKKTLHTINNNTINNKQYNFFSLREKAIAYEEGKRWDEKPYYMGNKMGWSKSRNKWFVFEDNWWKEYAGKDEEIGWR
jgi:hypothetical protein